MTSLSLSSALRYTFLVVCVALLSVLLATPAAAQDADTTSVSEAEILQEENEAAEQDTRVTAEDLNAEEATILPDSPWYGFKRFGRAFGEFITFDPVKKAEKKLQNANKAFAESLQLLQRKGNDEEAIADAAKNIERATGKIDSVRQAAPRLKEIRTEKKEAVEALTEKILKTGFTHQKVIDQVEEFVDERPVQGAQQILEHIHTARERSEQSTGELIGTIEDNPEALRERLNHFLDNEGGSDYRHIKHGEFLRRLEDHLPQQAADRAREAIAAARERQFEHLSEKIERRRGEDRDKFFEGIFDYAEHLPGDHAANFQNFEEFKHVIKDPELAARLEDGKDIFARRFKERLEHHEERFDDEATRERFREREFERFAGNEIEQIQAQKDLIKRIEFESKEFEAKIRKQEQEFEKKAAASFRERFTDADSTALVDRFEALSAQAAKNPTPAVFEALDALERELTPEQKRFVQEIEDKARGELERKFKEQGDEFFKRISTNVAEDVRAIEQLGQRFDHFDVPPELIDRAVREHQRHQEEKFERLEDREFERAARERIRIEEEFRARLDAVDSEVEHSQLLEEKRRFNEANLERELEARKRIFEERMEDSGPFCDERCQEIRREQFFQDFERHRSDVKTSTDQDIVHERDEFRRMMEFDRLEAEAHERGEEGEFFPPHPGEFGPEFDRGQPPFDRPDFERAPFDERPAFETDPDEEVRRFDELPRDFDTPTLPVFDHPERPEIPERPFDERPEEFHRPEPIIRDLPRFDDSPIDKPREFDRPDPEHALPEFVPERPMPSPDAFRQGPPAESFVAPSQPPSREFDQPFGPRPGEPFIDGPGFDVPPPDFPQPELHSSSGSTWDYIVEQLRSFVNRANAGRF